MGGQFTIPSDLLAPDAPTAPELVNQIWRRFDQEQFGIDWDKVDQAVKCSSFDALKEIENHDQFHPVHTSAKMFRKGGAGDFLNHFNEVSRELMNRVASKQLSLLGYVDGKNWWVNSSLGVLDDESRQNILEPLFERKKAKSSSSFKSSNKNAE